MQLALSLDPGVKQHAIPESILNHRSVMVGPALVREWRVSEREFINIKIQLFVRQLDGRKLQAAWLGRIAKGELV